jgi:hypothetical protein
MRTLYEEHAPAEVSTRRAEPKWEWKLKQCVADTLEMISRAPKEEQAALLREYQSPAMRTVLQYAFHPDIKWHLPKGDMPPGSFRPWKYGDVETALYGEAKRLYIFCSGPTGRENALVPFETDTREKQFQKRQKREKLFVELLEGIDPRDADMIIAAKDKKLHVDIDAETVKVAFPDLFQ